MCGGSSIWGHQWDLGSAGVPVPVVDGVEVGGLGYTTFGEMHCEGGAGNAPGHMATIGIMAHEFGHDINWPDLYDLDGSGEGIGEYSLMSGGTWSSQPGQLVGESPAHPDAWSLWYQGWVTPAAVTPGTRDVQVDTGESVLVSPNPGGVDWLFGGTSGTGEYFLIENRQKVGFDSALPGCGLVAYRIDETVTSSNAANMNENDPLVKVLEADGLDHLYLGTNRGDPGDAYPGSSNNHDLDDTSHPNTKFHTETASNVDVHIDSNSCGPTMQLDVLVASTIGAVHTPEPSTYGSASAISVTVSGGTGTPTGQVTVTQGAATVGAGVLDGSGQASVALPATTPAGSHDLAISYPGDATHDASTANVTATVNKAASGTSATAPRKVKFRKNFNVTATVTVPSGSGAGSVQVMEGSKFLGTATLSNGVATIRVTKNLRRGRHTLTVEYLGSANASGSQTTVVVRVKRKR